jgi:hypothetical protein
LYLPHFPKKLIRQVLYIFLWVSLYTMVEILSFRLGFFSYHNGWSIGWSFLFNCFMFSILWIHHKRPLAAIGIAFVAAVVMLTYFQVPFSSMK